MNSSRNKMLSMCLLVFASSSSLQGEWGWLAAKVGGGYTQPVNGISPRLKGGLNLNGGAGVNFGPYFSVLAEYTFMSNSLSEQFKTQNSLPGGALLVNAVTINPVLRLAGDRRISPYITGGFGWYRRTVEITRPTVQTLTLFDPFWNSFIPVQVGANEVLASYTVNKAGWNGGAGFDIKFGDSRAKLFAEARYHYVKTQPVALEIVPITVGVRW